MFPLLCDLQLPTVAKINLIYSCLKKMYDLQVKSANWPQPEVEFPPAAIVNKPPLTTCKTHQVLSTRLPIIQFLIAHTLCSRLSLHLPALQTGVAAMFPDLEAAAVSAAQGKRTGGAARKAGTESG